MYFKKFKTSSLITGVICSLLVVGTASANYVFNPFTKQLDRTVTGENVVLGNVTSTQFCLATGSCVTSTFGGSIDPTVLNDYLYMPGRSGGQTAYGGVTSSENLTFYSNQNKDGYINIGDNARLYEPYGQLQLGIDGISSGIDDDPNVPLMALADSDDYYVTNIYNVSTGTSAETGYIAANSDPTSYNYLAMLGVSNTLYATYNPGAALLEANAANLYINSLGDTPETGNVYIASGCNNSKDCIRETFTYDGKMGIGTTTPQYDIHIVKPMGIAMQQMQTNDTSAYAQTRMYAGDNGLALLALGATYTGSGSGAGAAFQAGNAAFQSLTDNFTLTNEKPNGKISFYTDGFETANYQMSINSSTLQVNNKLSVSGNAEITDQRDGSADRTALKVDTISGWTNGSKLAEFDINGVQKASIGPNGTYSQIKPVAFNTVAGVESTTTLLGLDTNRHYEINCKIAAKQGGNAGSLKSDITSSFHRYLPGDAVMDATTKSNYFYSSDLTDYTEFDVSGTNVILKIKTSVIMNVQPYCTFIINII